MSNNTNPTVAGGKKIVSPGYNLLASNEADCNHRYLQEEVAKQAVMLFHTSSVKVTRF
jgi:hypothetical protein